MSQDVFAEFMTQSDEAVKCGDSYAKYRLGGTEIGSFGAFAELTLTHASGGIVNDADISMVDGFYLPMSWDWLYNDASNLNQECYNTSLTTMPTPTSCGSNGGQWTTLPAAPYSGAPSGYCKAPNVLCQPGQARHPVCSQNLAAFQGLIKQIESVYNDLMSYKAFSWASSDRTLFPGHVWTCAGFQNTQKYDMAEMCAAINRGLCDLSTLGSLSATDFGAWTKNKCGSKQNQQPQSTWFVNGFVRNPYVYWLRRTLHGTTYAFSQDEGVHGGNSNCNNLAPTRRIPEYSRVTVCPQDSPRSEQSLSRGFVIA